MLAGHRSSFSAVFAAWVEVPTDETDTGVSEEGSEYPIAGLECPAILADSSDAAANVLVGSKVWVRWQGWEDAALEPAFQFKGDEQWDTQLAAKVAHITICMFILTCSSCSGHCGEHTQVPSHLRTPLS